MARILLADDDKDYGRAFSVSVASLGHDVTVATNGADAIEKVEQAVDPFDILFVDVMMPAGGAATVLHSQPVVASKSKVVIITGRAELYDSPLFQTGFSRADARVRKSISLGELEQLISDLLR
ncbi:response regulator [Sagittula sp. SSi028]|uniref:response regulator n=1 Tax=Sagittula sp. SSi028 TaxID=3400636 RepID=UPI003AF9F376